MKSNKEGDNADWGNIFGKSKKYVKHPKVNSAKERARETTERLHEQENKKMIDMNHQIQ